MPSSHDLNAQLQHWDVTFTNKPQMFGTAPSDPARAAAQLFKVEDRTVLLELGAGQGRDTLHFAHEGFHVTALDYSQAALNAIGKEEREKFGTSRIALVQHDVREPFPFEDESFDCCFSHMLFCMALTTPEIERLSREVQRVLKPGGLHVFTVRHTGDPHFGTGINRGEDMYEVGGFIVHFFSPQKVENLAKGWETVSIDEFDEGGLPRRLYRVTLRKP